MTKIKNYNVDNEVEAADKWIGTEDATGLTKNVTASKLGSFYRKAGFFLSQGSLKFKFFNFIDTRQSGTFSLNIGAGPVVPVSSLSDLVFSDYDDNGVDVSTFLEEMNGSVILLTKEYSVSDFGVFRVLSIEDLHPSEPNSLSVSLEFISGSGNVVDGSSYVISLLVDGSYIKLSDIGVDGRSFLFNFVAGEDISIGDVCDYGSDLKMYKADAVSTDKSTGLLAVAMDNVLNGNSASFSTWGVIETSGLVAGSRYHLSLTPGGIQTPELVGLTDSVTRCIGFAINETTLMFNPSNDFIINK